MVDMMKDRHVRRTAADYAEGFEALLPTGPAWSRDPDDALTKLVAGLTQVWGDVIDARGADLLEIETDPRQTLNMLPDWERAFGLPDPCDGEQHTIESRRAALIARMTLYGSQSIPFFVGVATALGYQIRIYEYLPVQCGISRCGETRPDATLVNTWFQCGVSQCSVNHLCDIVQTGNDDWVWRLGSPELRYVWRVEILNTTLRWFRCGTGVCGRDHLCEFSLATDLECLIRRWRPAHTEVLFDYSQVT